MLNSAIVPKVAWNHAAAVPKTAESAMRSLGEEGLIVLFTGCWSKTSEPERSKQRHGNDGRDSNDDETDDLPCCETRVLNDVVAHPAGKVLPLGVAKSLGEGSEGCLCRLEDGVCCVVHGLLFGFNKVG